MAGWEQGPALAELLPGFEMVGWFALLAPTGTPAAVIQRMNKELNTLLADAAVMQRMATPLGAPAPTGAFLGREYASWSSATKEIGLLPE